MSPIQRALRTAFQGAVLTLIAVVGKVVGGIATGTEPSVADLRLLAWGGGVAVTFGVFCWCYNFAEVHGWIPHLWKGDE